ncbi:hypothetical protein PC116_g1250 [Phytophthora cactorum]|nr:hypothetical protein PC119_g3778 [Phytophthora cactorum]KAG3179573.1 hypothetical protein C6341_g7438 [Phytophthora cactorum]KAG3186150.1 hypothetical protein PC128_g13067 [Phytophthora cactorum]KAG4054133.1 hypothetical protein PC123_g10736 [Phytophthora cactorum]KAG4251084.1 hypothetical protein PC116_g1250 [Phytophthora cactorum]
MTRKSGVSIGSYAAAAAKQNPLLNPSTAQLQRERATHPSGAPACSQAAAAQLPPSNDSTVQREIEESEHATL